MTQREWDMKIDLAEEQPKKYAFEITWSVFITTLGFVVGFAVGYYG